MQILQMTPKVLTGQQAILRARNVKSNERLRATDCLRIAPYSGGQDLYISTPNMEIIPELPEQNPSKPIAYFADGMLGLDEQHKWPQRFYSETPHAMAAPINPDLMHWKGSDPYHGVEQDFLIQDTHGVLPSFQDSKAPWFNFDESNFEVTNHIPHAQLGRLRLPLLSSLQDAIKDVLEVWTKLAHRLQAEAILRGDGAVKSFRGTLNYVQSTGKRLMYSCAILARGDLSTFHTVMWFREFQRLLLDLRAVIIYMAVIKPRLDDPTVDFSSHPLPLRGIITSKEYLLRELYRVGVPVWYIRPQDSLTTDTRIRRACTVVPVGVAFSSRRGMRHGQHERTAPALNEAPNYDPSSGGVLDRIQKISLTNRAIIGAVSMYNPDHAAQLSPEQQEEATAVAGPDIVAQDLPHPDLGDNEETWVDTRDEGRLVEGKHVHIAAHRIILNCGFLDHATWDDYSSGDLVLTESPGIVDHGACYWAVHFTIRANAVTSTSSVFVQPSNQHLSSSSNSVSSGRTSSRLATSSTTSNHDRRTESIQGKGKKPKSVKSVVRPENPPSWVPPEAPGWSSAANCCGLGDEEEFPKSYHLPMPYMFFQARADNRGVMVRLHNWLRIRLWCIKQVVETASHGMVLMSGNDWRTALEGAYYQVNIEPIEGEDAERTSRRAAQLALLPKDPRSDGSPPPKRQKVDNAGGRERRRRLAARGEINVRFGLHAGFHPYDFSETSQWGSASISHEGMKSSDLWAEVVWELSVLNFRLELLQLDRIHCPSLYIVADGGFSRSQAIADVWGRDGLVSVQWTTARNVDLLSGSSDVRTPALQRLATVLAEWPGGSHLREMCRKWPEVNSDRDIYLFYIRSAHAVFNRIPAIPLVQPRSMDRFFI